MSFNSLLGLGNSSAPATLELHAPCMDDAASTTVVDYSGNSENGTLTNAGNTSASSTTGPNSWLTKVLNFDGSNDYVSFASTVHDPIETSNKFTVFLHHNPDTTSGVRALFDIDGGLLEIRSGKYRSWLFSGSGNLNNIGSSASATGFQTLAMTWDGTTLTHYEDGSSVTSTGTARTLTSGTGVVSLGIRNNGSTDPFDGLLGGLMIWSTNLSSAEITELENGPEPENTVAPAVTGTEAVGETLSCSTGTWALPSPYASGSNGTVTYTYQWYRSDDGVADGSAISGATSSTYTLTAADVGKYIHCLVASSNDGGNSADEDTFSNFTGAIVGAGRPTLMLTGVGF